MKQIHYIKDGDVIPANAKFLGITKKRIQGAFSTYFEDRLIYEVPIEIMPESENDESESEND